MSSATRTAGIWRLVNGEWRLFAEGLFDSLGVVVEDGKGLTVVAGQKAELTRIRDTNGDGIADDYETLFDAQFVPRQLPQLHARAGARPGWVLLLRASTWCTTPAAARTPAAAMSWAAGADSPAGRCA